MAENETRADDAPQQIDDWSTLNTTVESDTVHELIVRDNIVNANSRFIRLRVEAP